MAIELIEAVGTGRGKMAIAAGLLAAAALPALAHTDDPKVRDRVPPYAGLGYRAAVDGPVTNAPVGFPAQGVLLRSWLPLSEFGSPSNANDCWGYTAPSGREYALLGHYNGTSFVEVTNPDNAQVVTTIGGPQSLWSDVKVYQQHAYAVTEGSGAGIQVFDLSQIDAGTVSLVNTINTGGATSTHNVAINEASGYLYRCGGDNNLGVRVYSLANPAAPLFVNQWNVRYVHDLQVHTYDSGPWAGREIAFCCSGFNGGWAETGLDILDVTDKQNIVELGRLVYPNGAYSHQVWLSDDGERVYLNDELDEDGGIFTRTFVIDVTDLESPTFDGYFDNQSTAIGHNLYVKGNLIFEANYRSGLRVFDATDPLDPVEIAWFDTWPEDDDASFNGLWSNYPFFESGTIIGSDIEKGLFVWTLDQPQVAIAFPSGTPELVDPAGQSVEVEITELEPKGLVTGSERLHYAVGEGFVEVPLESLGGDLYAAPLPATECGSVLAWYVSATSANGQVVTNPGLAPSVTFEALAAVAVAETFGDDFETDLGWAVTDSPGLSAGTWERGVPAGAGDRGDPPADADGSSRCYLTENVAGNSDVDGGATTLTSPALDASGGRRVVSYWRWYSNTEGSSPQADIFEVEISDDGGATWRELETVGPGGPEVSGGWYQRQFDLAVIDGFEPNDQFRIRFTASDLGDGSVVEAGVDGVALLEVDCGPDAVPGDTDGDGDVDFEDLLGLLAAWGPCPAPPDGCPADFDGSGGVDFGDLLTLLGNWGA